MKWWQTGLCPRGRQLKLQQIPLIGGKITTKKRKKLRLSDAVNQYITPIDKEGVVMYWTDANITISQISSFAIKKVLGGKISYIETISILHDSNLLVLAGNPLATETKLKSISLANSCLISVKLHNKLNSVKDVIYAPWIKHVLEEEILREMSNQDVTEVCTSPLNWTLTEKLAPL